MSAILGLLFIFIGAFSSGSFAVPFGGVKGWKWENYWLTCGLSSFIVVPLAVCFLFVKDFTVLMSAVAFGDFMKIFLLGAAYGIGSITFGLSMRYLGLSLGYALSLGLMAAIGTLVPPLIDGSFGKLLETTSGNMVLAGIVVALLGIAGIGYAGYRKDQMTETDENSEFNFNKGLIAVVMTGIMGSAMSLGINEGASISVMAEQMGTDPLYSSNATMFILLLGTFLTTLVWCFYLMISNNTLKDYVSFDAATTLKNLGLTFLAGFLWYLQFIFFGMGKSKMGEYSFAAWGILMAFIIVIAMFWGMYKGEWNGVTPGVKRVMFISLGVIVIGSFIIGAPDYFVSLLLP